MVISHAKTILYERGLMESAVRISARQRVN
nr:MAG TPA: hypothetical protein [Bacteriophage sp.]